MEKKTSDLLLILAVCFVVVFALVLISVNNWLKQTLKEETFIAPKQQQVLIPEKSKYKQMPIVVAVPNQSVAASVKKSQLQEKSAGVVNTEINQGAPIANKILVN